MTTIMTTLIASFIHPLRDAARYNPEVQTAPPASSGLTAVACGRS